MLEICTLSNLVALAVTSSGISFAAKDAFLSEDKFKEIVNLIFQQINMFSKWEKEGWSTYLL